jgi:hypothetical protein
MNTFKSLDPPHKGLRNALGKLALATGKTDYTSLSSVSILKKIANEVFHLLKDHTNTENKFILSPLENREPGSTKDYLNDHYIIDEKEKNLFEQFNSLNGKQSIEEGHLLYLDFCRFQSIYLEHINEEDSSLESKLQMHFTAEELMQHQIEIMKEMDFETLLLWFKYIVPARRPEENAQVLSGFKSVAPKLAYETVLNTIRTEIEEQEMNQILSMIK